MITIPELNSVSSISDNDLVMITHSNGTSEKITGANFKAVINNLASSIADTKIAGYVPGLDAVTTLADTDVVMVTHSDQTSEKITGANLKAQVLGSISDLTAETTLADTDIVYIKKQDGTLKKMTGASLKAQVLGSISDLTAETTLADTDIVYIKKQDGTLKKMTLANLKGSPVPLGTVAGYEGSSAPADGQWLICDGRDTTGTDEELETYYPSLYTFRGGSNVLPEIFDHSKPSEWEDITISTDANNRTVIPYDGELFITTNGDPTIIVWVNDISFKINSRHQYTCEDLVLPLNKGDRVYFDVQWSSIDYCRIKYYKQHKIIKATASTDSYTPPSSEIQEIESYFDQGITAVKEGFSLSTTETPTGRTYLGKPTYTKVFTGLTSISTSWTTIPDSTNNYRCIVSIDFAFSGTRSGYLQSRINNGHIEVSTNTAMSNIEGIYVEYSKSTD